jgi:hypothetical protein
MYKKEKIRDIGRGKNALESPRKHFTFLKKAGRRKIFFSEKVFEMDRKLRSSRIRDVLGTNVA